jgi:hypothetical protein
MLSKHYLLLLMSTIYSPNFFFIKVRLLGTILYVFIKLIILMETAGNDRSYGGGWKFLLEVSKEKKKKVSNPLQTRGTLVPVLVPSWSPSCQCYSTWSVHTVMTIATHDLSKFDNHKTGNPLSFFCFGSLLNEATSYVVIQIPLQLTR